MNEPTISGRMPNCSVEDDHTVPVMNFPRPYSVTIGRAFHPTKMKISATAKTNTNAHMKNTVLSRFSLI